MRFSIQDLFEFSTSSVKLKPNSLTIEKGYFSANTPKGFLFMLLKSSLSLSLTLLHTHLLHSMYRLRQISFFRLRPVCARVPLICHEDNRMQQQHKQQQ